MLTEVDPANGHFLLGIIYNDAGNVEMSKKELEEAVKIDPRLNRICKVVYYVAITYCFSAKI